jgi:hypothetical protein
MRAIFSKGLIKKPVMREISLDNQLFLAPTQVEWAALLADGQLRGKPLSSTFIRTAELCLTVAATHSELSVLILILDNRFLFPKVFLEINTYQQRIFLERLTCAVCGWSGMAGEPLVQDNYVGLSNDAYQTLLKIALQFPILPCPVCSTKLPRHPIWLEYKR